MRKSTNELTLLLMSLLIIPYVVQGVIESGFGFISNFLLLIMIFVVCFIFAKLLSNLIYPFIFDYFSKKGSTYTQIYISSMIVLFLFIVALFIVEQKNFLQVFDTILILIVQISLTITAYYFHLKGLLLK